jgi:sugar lactone lactonase YvrE
MLRSRYIAFSVMFFAVSISFGFAQSGIITTYVGPGSPVNGELAVSQAIDYPTSIVPDKTGGFYVASQTQNKVYWIDSSGRVNVVVGNGVGGFSGDGRPAAAAQLNHPYGIVLDKTGSNLYISDSGNNRIRKVGLMDGIIQSFAGDGSAGYSGDGGLASAAQLNEPTGLATDSAGNLYFADSKNNVIRKVSAAGKISTLAGIGVRGYGGDGGVATAAKLSNPTGVTTDSAGNIYIADSGIGRIRIVTSDGIIDTVAGGGFGSVGDGGPAKNAYIRYPTAVAFDSAGRLVIADYNDNRVRMVSAAGIISTIAGNGSPGFSGDGGPATAAQLDKPGALAYDSGGLLYVADSGSSRVRRVAVDGTINTVAGNGTGGSGGDGGLASAAQLTTPFGITVDFTGNLFIADYDNFRVRKVTPDGIVSTLAGNGISGYSGDGGPATAAQLNNPAGVAFDSSGNVYIADYKNNRVRKVVPGGVISTIAGNGEQGHNGDGGPATAAQLSSPLGVAVDSAGNLYVTDAIYGLVRKVTTAGIISTVAGNGSSGYGGDDGPATAASLFAPYGLAVDSAGNIFVADTLNSRIRKITAAGVISTVAGTGEFGYSGDGRPATSAALNFPYAVAVDSAGNLFIPDTGNNRIRQITPNGIIRTVIGNGIGGFSGDYGTAVSAQINYPTGLAFDAKGSLFVADENNHRIRKITSILDCSSLAVSSGGVAACRTAGTNTTTRSGYAKLEVNSGATPYGTAVFRFKQSGVTVTEAGVPASPPTTRAWIFIDYRASVTAIPGRSDSGTIDINTGLSVVNQGSATANVVYTLRKLSGETLAVGHGTITRGNHIACFINQLQQMAAPDFSLPSNFQSTTQFGTLDISCDQPISVIALRMTNNQREEALFTTTPVADMTKASTNTPIYFPQFADGGGYTTSLILLNTSSQTETGSLQVLDNNGNPWVVSQVGGTTNSSFQYSIPAGGAYHFQSDGLPASASAGWVRIVPDVSSMTPIGSGVFSYNPSSVLVSESGIPSSVSTTHARVYVDLSEGHNAGLAIANISGTAASITIHSYQTDGAAGAGSSKGPLSLAAYGHDAKFADQLIEGLPAGYRGVLDISSTTPFAALTMRSLKNERDDFLMTTFPIADANQTAPSPIVIPHVADGGGYVTEFILISAGAAANTTPGFYNEAGAPTDFGNR